MTERSVDKKTQVRSTEEALSTERALKLALDALESMYSAAHDIAEPAITAIRSALAQSRRDEEQPAQQQQCMEHGECFGGECIYPAPQPAQQQEPVAWRELCRRLYVELYWCDRQMMQTLDENGEPMWTQGKTVRDVLADAKAALDTPPPPRKPWVGLTDWEREKLRSEADDADAGYSQIIKATEAKLREKNT